MFYSCVGVRSRARSSVRLGTSHQATCAISPVLLDTVAEFPKRDVVFRKEEFIFYSALFGKLLPWSIATGVV